MYKNSEGYPDPTCGKALAKVAREEKAKAYMPLVYIASPFAGDTEHNIERAKDFCRFAVSRGVMPLAPHLHYPQFMEDTDSEQRKLGLRFALILLSKCDELWVLGERISEGMAIEINKAQRKGIPIKYFNSKCEEVL